MIPTRRPCDPSPIASLLELGLRPVALRPRASRSTRLSRRAGSDSRGRGTSDRAGHAARGLRILRLADAPMPAARLRDAPGPGRVSTIEAIARALRLLEGDAVATPLERLFDLAVERARKSGRQVAARSKLVRL